MNTKKVLQFVSWHYGTHPLGNIRKREEVVRYLSRLKSPKICEIGVREGYNFELLLVPNAVEGIAVDMWRDTGDVAQNDRFEAQEELSNYYRDLYHKYKDNDRVSIIREHSVQAATFFEDEYFDFVYIDADHTYEGVLADLQAWYPKVKMGGIIGGHDYAEEGMDGIDNWLLDFGVIKAVKEFRELHGILDHNFHTTGREHDGEEFWASYYIVKKEKDNIDADLKKIGYLRGLGE